MPIPEPSRDYPDVVNEAITHSHAAGHYVHVSFQQYAEVSENPAYVWECACGPQRARMH